MKKLLLPAMLTPIVLLLQTSLSVAQQDDHKYWEQAKEHAKKQDEYWREHYKEQDEFYREQNKRAYEYHKEMAKRDKEYRKEMAKRDKKLRKGYHKNGVPPWAKAHGYQADHHVYFPDFGTFYDAYRGGYAFLDKGRWQFSVSLPPFLANIDLGKAQIRLMTDAPLTKHPEDYYEEYTRDEPRIRTND